MRISKARKERKKGREGKIPVEGTKQGKEKGKEGTRKREMRGEGNATIHLHDT